MKILSVLKSFAQWVKKQIMFRIAIIAGLIWFAFWLSSIVAGTESFPVGYWQKIPFGLVTAAIGLSCGILYMKTTFPNVYDIMKEDTDGGINSFTEWQKALIWMFYITIFVVSFLAGVLAL
jgi:hypothetical protein